MLNFSFVTLHASRFTILPVVLLFTALASCNKVEEVTDYDGTFTDPRDSTVYPYVIIGTQTWMAVNLNYGFTDTKGWWCYNSAEGNCDTYGRLYTWEKARIACPAGWHLPSDAEWKKLEIQAGMPASLADSTGWRSTGSAGIGLKARKGWNSGGNGENTVRFSAIPSGIQENGNYSSIGDLTQFWTSDYPDETHALGRGLIYYEPGVYRWKYGKSNGYSVRCIKN